MAADEDAVVDSSAVHSVSPISPVYRIPPEVILEIFECYLPEEEFPRPSVRSAPLQLTQVCHTWRKLAFSTPRLWCKLLVKSRECGRPEEPGSIHSARALDATALDIWMNRAGALPMSVHIRYASWAGELDVPSSIFRIIVDNPTRRKELKLSMTPSTVIKARSLVQQNVLNLETLEIEDTTYTLPEDCVSHATLFMLVRANIAQSLSTLSVRASIVYRNRHNTPFQRLHRLSMKHTTIGDCLRLLIYCPVLEDLNLHFCDIPESPEDETAGPAILLQRLRTFHLAHTENSMDEDSAVDQGARIGRLVDRLELPRLEGFYLLMPIIGSAGSTDFNRPWGYLSRLIIRSNCSLKRLEFRSLHMDTPSILECLRLSPDLTYLGIQADEELERNVGHLLPRLESLRIFE